MNFLGERARTRIPSGAVTSPGLNFSIEGDTGIYLDTPGTGSGFAIAKRGVKRMKMDDTKTEFFGPVVGSFTIPGTIELDNGSVGAPSLTFLESKNTGLYKNSEIDDGGIGISIHGTPHTSFTDTPWQMSTDNVVAINVSTAIVAAGDGAVATPSITFASAPDTGIYRDTGTGQIRLSVSGSDALNVASNSLGCSAFVTSGTTTTHLGLNRLDSSAGSSTAPELCWTTDTATGLHHDVSPKRLIASVDGDPIVTIGNDFFDTNHITCQDTKATYLQVDDGSLTDPSLRFAAFNTTGIYRDTASGQIRMSIDGVDGFNVAQTSIGCSAFVTSNTTTTLLGLLRQDSSSGSITDPELCWVTDTSTGLHYSSAPAQITCSVGATPVVIIRSDSLSTTQINCQTIGCTGDVKQPRYYVRSTLAANISITPGTDQLLIWDTADTAGSAASNWPITYPVGTHIAPVNGFYSINYVIVFKATTLGRRSCWCSINGGTRKWGAALIPFGDDSSIGGTFFYRLTAGDTVSVYARTTNAIATDIVGGALSQCGFQIDRLSE